MTRFKLAFGIHNHQPVGNFEEVFEEAHHKAYLPFLKLLQRFAGLSISLHQSGILWEWQRAAHHDYFELVSQLVKSGRVELMTGGFYEPILVSIPQRDGRGQIRMLNDYLEEHFGVSPDGLWLTERIWEPHLPELLAASRVKYLPIDDTHFLYAGFELDQLTGPFVTEHEGNTLTLLPIQKRLRYLIPFGTVDQVITDLKRQAERDPGGVAVYADDGEKFGVWPQTHEHCYTDRWLELFFEAVELNSDWLELIPLGEAARLKPVGRAYLPTASYAEMLHWSLPPKAFVEYEEFEQWLKKKERLRRFGRFVRGGHWRGFLTKYDEANLMHKKMLAVSAKLAEYEHRHPESQDQVAQVRRQLYAGQCNCPYWHGVFGGLYLPHIRRAVFSKLIEADHTLNRLLQRPALHIAMSDYDCDGHDEVVVTSDAYTAVIKPDKGGTLQELSLNRYAFNLTDTLTRRREGYHSKLARAVVDEPPVPDQKSAGTQSIHDLVLAKEKGLQNYLVDDWYIKRCFIDHFLSNDVDLARFQSGRFGENGDFIVEPFQVETHHEPPSCNLVRDGHLWRPDGVIPVRVVKRYEFLPEEERFQVTYEVSSSHSEEVRARFAVENNFTFQSGCAEDRYVVIDNRHPEEPYLEALARHEQACTAALVDQYQRLAVAVTSSRPAEIWRLPIYTVSLSEGGFERVYQGTTLVHIFSVRLTGSPFAVQFTVRAGSAETVLNGVASGISASRR